MFDFRRNEREQRKEEKSTGIIWQACCFSLSSFLAGMDGQGVCFAFSAQRIGWVRKIVIRLRSKWMGNNGDFNV